MLGKACKLFQTEVRKPCKRLSVGGNLTNTHGWESAPCVKSNESLCTLSLSELSESQCLEELSFSFLPIPQPLPTVSFTVTAASLKPSREMPCEKQVLTIFSPRTKIFRLFRERPSLEYTAPYGKILSQSGAPSFTEKTSGELNWELS